MDAMVIPLMALLIPIVVAPTAMGIKYARQVRELEHKERMKALELGRTLPRDEPWWTPPRLAAAMGVGVPVGVFVCAMLASQGPGHDEGPWIAAIGVGMTGVISGAVLAGRHYSQR